MNLDKTEGLIVAIPMLIYILIVLIAIICESGFFEIIGKILKIIFADKETKKFNKACRWGTSYDLTYFRSYSNAKRAPGTENTYLQKIILSEKLSLYIYWNHSYSTSKRIFVVNNLTEEIRGEGNDSNEFSKYISLKDFKFCISRYELFSLFEKAFQKERDDRNIILDRNIKQELSYNTGNIIKLANCFPELIDSVKSIIEIYNKENLTPRLYKRMTNYYLPEIENILSRYGSKKDIRYKTQILEFAEVIKNRERVSDEQNAKVICSTFRDIINLESKNKRKEF